MRRLVVFIVLAAVAALSALAWRRFRSGPAAPPAHIDQKPTPPASSTALFTGRIQPQKMVSISAPAAGTIARVLVEAGQDVYAGELLAQLNNGKLAPVEDAARQDAAKADSRVTDLRAELESAQMEASKDSAAAVAAHAAMTSAEKEFVRQQALDRAGATPHLAFLKAQSDYQTALAGSENLDALAQRDREHLERVSRELAAARSRLEERSSDFASIDTVSEIRSPVDGVVIAQEGKAGDAVNPAQSTLFQIAVNLSLLDVAVTADSKTLDGIQAGAPATVRIAEAGDVEIPAAVREVSGTGLLVGFESPSAAIRPGMTALVRVARATRGMRE